MTNRTEPILKSDVLDDDWSVHGQFTYVNQGHPRLTAPYSGPNSMTPAAQQASTADATLFLGRRLWSGAQFWLNPEYDQGYGLSNTLGMAGFPSGEAYKVGQNVPYLRFPRAFIRQVISLDGEAQTVEASTNQFADNYSANNVVITVGRFSVVDIFDTNAYAHDPRSNFLNWSIIEAGTFDYAADSWGFTNGATVEWNQDSWTLRGGVFQMSDVPNAKVAGFHPHQHSYVTELERRYQWSDHPGKVKLMAFLNQGDMGTYSDATNLAAATGSAPNTALVRRQNSNPGVSLNVEQELTHDLGAFLRMGVNGGKQEAYEFSDIHRTVSGGLSLRGGSWGRAADTVGLGAAINGLSSSAKAYFAAGGNGILIGDGQLHYGCEKIVEAYYSVAVSKDVKLTFDYQHVTNPAYNRDRGPFPIYSLRMHAEL
ncbi:carbohydrate porin [Glaciimonas sp. GG7]